MDYLLDSDILIDYLKKKDPDILINLVKDNSLHTSVISWSEIYYGIVKSSNPAKFKNEFKDFLKDFKIEILPVDQNIVSSYVDIKISLEQQGKPLADFDLLIAATTISKNMILVTRNVRHFSRIPELKIFETN